MMNQHKQFLLIAILTFVAPDLMAQKRPTPVKPPVITEKPFVRPTLGKAELKKFKTAEDSLKILGEIFVNDSIAEKRQKACYDFIPMFIRALKNENSFFYPFDSLVTVSKIYPNDSTFRIFTWMVHTPDNRFRCYGAIQMRSSELKLFPLIDVSDTIETHTQEILSPSRWYGALYYNIMTNLVGRKKYYTLFGFDRADRLTKRKVLEILSFDEAGKPVFGAPLFHFKHTDTARYTKEFDTLNRFFIEYKWNANPVLNYDSELELIVFDHVVPPSDKAKDAWFTYVPDGTYEGFKWANNRWNWVEKIFTFAINEDDNPPIPVPIFGKPSRQPILPDAVPK